jgi:hypothetical protein
MREWAALVAAHHAQLAAVSTHQYFTNRQIRRFFLYSQEYYKHGLNKVLAKRPASKQGAVNNCTRTHLKQASTLY